MTAISLYVARDEDGNDVGSFYAECGLSKLSIEEFFLEIPDETGELDKQKNLIAARKLFLAIVDHKPIKHNSGLKVIIPQEGQYCLILYDGVEYSRGLTFVDVMRRVDQFIIGEDY
jgi:hypothetical protein